MGSMVSESQKNIGVAPVAESGPDIAVLSESGIRQELRAGPSVRNVVIVIKVAFSVACAQADIVITPERIVRVDKCATFCFFASQK